MAQATTILDDVDWGESLNNVCLSVLVGQSNTGEVTASISALSVQAAEHYVPSLSKVTDRFKRVSLILQEVVVVVVISDVPQVYVRVRGLG